jgi:hypothetical protein
MTPRTTINEAHSNGYASTEISEMTEMSLFPAGQK